jgi:hypothetical protein
VVEDEVDVQDDVDELDELELDELLLKLLLDELDCETEVDD